MFTKFNLKLVSVILVSVTAISCDEDYNTIGTDVIGDSHYTFETPDNATTIVAYNHSIDIVQSNNLEVNQFGIYNNSTFGKTVAQFATQLTLPNPAPTFTNITAAPLVTEVILYIPYFSTATTAADGVKTFTLDSIKGNSKLKLSIFENGYLMKDFDPTSNFTVAQKYYTNQTNDFELHKRGAGALGESISNGERLNNSIAVKENDEFVFDATEISETTGTGTTAITTKYNPGIYLKLNLEFFQKKIIDGASNGDLANNNVFKNYFRGLYFKVEQSAADLTGSSLAMINFNGGTIKIKYKEDKAVENSVIPERVDKELVLTMSGNSVNVLEHQKTANYTNALANASAITGDEKLYLKGGAGSMAIIDLFGRDANGLSAELNTYRAKGWLINEANLTFTIDKDEMGTNPEPNRIYLYDLNNKRPLVDFFNDNTSNSFKPKYGKIIHGGIIKKETSRGISYKIRITNHISNLLKNADSTNVRLGLVVTESINIINNAAVKNPTQNIKAIPLGSVLSPLGTVLYGSRNSVPLDKRLKLEIYYTKPN